MDLMLLENRTKSPMYQKKKKNRRPLKKRTKILSSNKRPMNNSKDYALNAKDQSALSFALEFVVGLSIENASSFILRVNSKRLRVLSCNNLR